MIKHSLALLVVALPLHAQSVDHRTLSSPAAIYNIAGTIHVVRGTGSDITIDVTRGGRDADKLSIATGLVGDRQTFRVLYPSDRIVYPRPKEHAAAAGAPSSRSMTTARGTATTIGAGAASPSSGTATGWKRMRISPCTCLRGARLALYLAAGDASVSRCTDGDLLADVDEASITIDHTHGALDLDTGSGDLIVRDAQR